MQTSDVYKIIEDSFRGAASTKDFVTNCVKRYVCHLIAIKEPTEVCAYIAASFHQGKDIGTITIVPVVTVDKKNKGFTVSLKTPLVTGGNFETTLTMTDEHTLFCFLLEEMARRIITTDCGTLQEVLIPYPYTMIRSLAVHHDVVRILIDRPLPMTHFRTTLK